MKKILYLIGLTLITLTSCSKSDDKPKVTIDETDVTMKYDGERQFKLSTNETAEWTTSDESVGTISQSGLFKAKKIGTAKVKATGSGFSVESTVTVEPYSNMCVEPYFILNENKANTKTKEKRTLQNETSTGLLYTGENSKVRYIMYLFENNKMTSAAILMSNTSAVIKESATFFAERYTPIAATSGFYIFTNNKDIEVAVTNDSDLGFVALYTKRSSTKTSSTSSDRTDDVLAKIKAELKK